MKATRFDRLYALTERLHPRIERGLDEGRDVSILWARFLALVAALERESRPQQTTGGGA